MTAGGLTRQQAAPAVTIDEESGTATIVTTSGQRVVVMGAPPDLRGFIDILRSQGTSGVEIRPGQFLASLTTPSSSLSLRLGFSVTSSPGPPTFLRNPGGIATVTYGTGQGQAALPVFADIPVVLGAVRAPELPGLQGIAGDPAARATLEGLVTATITGRTIRARPGFEVLPGSGAKRFLVEPDGGFAFDFGDGRRQRFSIVR